MGNTRCRSTIIIVVLLILVLVLVRSFLTRQSEIPTPRKAVEGFCGVTIKVHAVLAQVPFSNVFSKFPYAGCCHARTKVQGLEFSLGVEDVDKRVALVLERIG
jgi:hypothetical protein